MSSRLQPPSSVYEELERLPEQLTGEIIGGELLVSPLLGVVHTRAGSRLIRALWPVDEPGEQDPGGWVLLRRVELHLGDDVLVPLGTGWRRERMPVLPDVVGVELVPDWVCEVLSPSTEALIRGRKMAVYAREGVKHLWLVDARIQSLEVFRLESRDWVRLGVYTGDAVVRAEPFEVLPVKLAALWAR